MAETTKIQWTDHSWSPWEGCTKISPACDNCYAERMNTWLKAGSNWGPGAPRHEYSEDHWEKPLRWAAKAEKEGRRPKVFPSVCDPFDNEVRPELRARFFALIRSTQSLTWLLLTKRIGNAPAMLPPDWRDGYPNVWIGATTANQPEFDRYVRRLRHIPAARRFVCIEPMLGPIYMLGLDSDGRPMLDGIHWAIIGGESGYKARPMNPAWMRYARDQFNSAGVPLFVKQMGGIRDKRGNLEDLPEDLRIRSFPS